MSKRDVQDVANALLSKARGDAAGLSVLVDHADVPDHVSGFLAQQAIEKAFKAVLTAREVRFERSHDLDYLSVLLEDSGLSLPTAVRAAVVLTPWAVEFRYGDSLQSGTLDRTEVQATVAVVIAWANDTVNV